MKIYKDPHKEEEVKGNDIQLGIVKAGTSKKFEFYVYNETDAVLTDIKFEVPHKEVEIVSAPKELTSKAMGKLVIEWTPSITLKQGLRTLLRVEASELWS